MKKIYILIFIAVILAAVFYEYEGREAKILFVGDMMFDRYIRQVGYNKGENYVFSCIGNFLKDSDLVAGNLEGPITNNASKSMFTVPGGDNNFTFTFPTNTAKLLAENNIKLVNLGNNHMLNFGRSGLLQTKKYLEEAGVNYFGDPDSVENEKVARMEIAGIPLSFVNWSDWNSDNTDITAAQIKKEAGAGRKVIVYTHWGEEYVPPPERVRKLAHSFIDAGADLVVGSHPHIIQESEIYPSNSSHSSPSSALPSESRTGQAGKPIYYSLGNFIFDQYWNNDVSTGLVLEVHIKRSVFSGEPSLQVIEHKVSLLKDGRTCLSN
jgi:poly-gamma-glutamate synthesis protein (capsule biosynthesis protein)